MKKTVVFLVVVCLFLGITGCNPLTDQTYTVVSEHVSASEQEDENEKEETQYSVTPAPSTANDE
jgi:hypothetical protein